MPSSPDHDDRWLLDRMAEAVAALDPMPPRVLDAARGAFDQRDPAVSQVAELHTDSALDPPVGLRDAHGHDLAPRYLVFRRAGLSLRVEVTARSGRRDLVGEVTPWEGTGPLRVCWPGGQCDGTVHAAHAGGGFVVRDIPAGPVRLVFPGAAEAVVATSWICL